MSIKAFHFADEKRAPGLLRSRDPLPVPCFGSGSSGRFHLEDSIGDIHGGIPVRDQDDRLIPGGFPQGPKDDPFVQGIQIGHGLIQQHQRRVMQKGPGQADSLPFPAGKRVPHLAHRRVVAPGQALNKLMDRRFPCRGFDLLSARVKFTNRNVGGYAVMEQRRLLCNITLGFADILSFNYRLI